MVTIRGYDEWKLATPPEYDEVPDPTEERSDFACPECGEDLGEDDECDNGECERCRG